MGRRESGHQLASHGVGFDTARLACRDPFALVREDRREAYTESRDLLLGMARDRLLAVVYSPRGERFRIISARLAEPRERRRYHEENADD